MNAEGHKTLVIPRLDQDIKNLFVTICEEHLQIERNEAFKTILYSYVEKVLQEIEMNPNHDEYAVQAIRDKAAELMLPKVRAGLWRDPATN